MRQSPLRPVSLYSGRIENGRHVVYADGDELDPRPSQKVRNHSPDGFAWGYAGSGPAQLALAILLRETNDPEEAQDHYQRFKFELIATLDADQDWTMTGAYVRHWLEEERRRRRGASGAENTPPGAPPREDRPD